MNKSPLNLNSCFLITYFIVELILSSPLALSEPLGDKNSETLESAQNEPESNNFFEFKGILGIAYQSQFYRGQDFNFLPVLAITLDAEYESWFVESNSNNRISGVMGKLYLGYHLWESPSEQLDFVLGHYMPAIDKDDFDGEAIPELINLDKRNDDRLFGVKYNHWLNDSYYSIELGYDLIQHSHRGFVLEAYYGKTSSIQNWDLTYGIGYSWFSAKASDYNLGVRPHELTEQLSIYTTGASYTLDLELSAQTPISQNWVLELGVIHRFLSSNIKNSPLIVNEEVTSVLLGFSYVF